MIEIKVEQGTPEWRKMRRGKVTGTRLGCVFKADNLTLIDELIGEIGTDEDCEDEGYQSKAMADGKEDEPLAREVYMLATGIEIEEVGFCLSEWNEYLALSPDGFTPCRTGGVEFKCPTPKIHVKYIRQNQLPAEHRYQVYDYFLVNPELEWMDFVSFCKKFKPRPMFKKRVYRDDILNELADTKAGLEKFTEKLEKYYKQVTN